MHSAGYLLIGCFFITFSLSCQELKEEQKYLGQVPPGITPKVFAPGIISLESVYEFGSVFNKEGTAFYYGANTDSHTIINFLELKNGQWTTPKTILSNANYGMNDPFLSPDEQRLYFISQKALSGSGAKDDHDIWYVQKQGEGWSEPINAGPIINTSSEEYYISFTQNGTMYFATNKPIAGQKQNNFDMYASAYKKGQFQKAERLSDAVNSPYYEADVFVAPDESYLIYCSQRPEGMGRGDLYISFKNQKGVWSKAVNMGPTINSKDHELCPFVTADGKYLFYTSKKDIYWVSAKILDQFKE